MTIAVSGGAGSRPAAPLGLAMVPGPAAGGRGHPLPAVARPGDFARPRRELQAAELGPGRDPFHAEWAGEEEPAGGLPDLAGKASGRGCVRAARPAWVEWMLQGIKQHASAGEPAIEAYCNRTASLALVDSGEFSKQWQSRDESKELEEQIEGIADYFKVSEEVIARRLLDRDVIRVADYEQLRQFYHARWLAHAVEEKRRQKESRGGPSYYTQKLQANSRSLTQAVLGACSGGTVTLRDACLILGVRVGHLPKLAAAAGINLASVQGGNP